MKSAATRAYTHVLQFVRDTPWAVLPEALTTVRDVIGAHLEGWKPSAEEIVALEEMAARRPASYATGAIAVLPVQGMIVPKASLFTAMSGGCSLDQFCQMLADAVNDPSVSQIVLDIDSPGGSADMVPETAAVIRAAAAQKPIIAVSNTMAASAAYWLASQATELCITPSGDVGSIGVFAAHQDVSQMQQMRGVKTTFIKAGRFKTEGNPFEPLSPEAQQAIQARVDDIYQAFVSDVAKGRKTTPETVMEGFGQGRMVAAQDAVAAGMADRVETLQQTLTRLSRGNAGRGGIAATELPEPDGLPDDDEVDDLEHDDAPAATAAVAPAVSDEELAEFMARDGVRAAYSTGR